MKNENEGTWLLNVGEQVVGKSFLETRKFAEHEIARQALEVNLQFDGEQARAVIADFAGAIESASLEARNAIKGRLDFFDRLIPHFFEIVALDDGLPPAGANTMRIGLKATDRNRDFVAAIRAGDVNRVVGHLEFSGS